MLLTLIMANWRLTSLLNREQGPGDLLAKLRQRLGVRYDVRSNAYATTNLAEGVLCFWCCSIWMAIVVTLLAVLTKKLRLHDLPLYVLAVSTGAILLEEIQT